MTMFSLRKKLGSSSLAFLIGMTISGVYYAFVHMPFMHDSILHAYTTHHATEYAIVLLFFWASAEHFICYRRGTLEKFAISRISMPDHYGLEDANRAGELLEGLTLDHSAHSQSMIYKRLQSALKFVYERQSTDGFREYLESLESRDSNQLFERYGFSRFVTTILPILGLIGTVVHFGAALTGLSMEGLTEKLPKMLSSMGTAFNTTFSAMTCMVATFLARFLIERRDNELLLKIDAFAEDELLHRFQSTDSATKQLTELLSASNSSQPTPRANLVHFLGMVERQQETYVAEVRQWSNELVVAQKMTNEIASSLVADGQLLQLQDRLAENLTLQNRSRNSSRKRRSKSEVRVGASMVCDKNVVERVRPRPDCSSLVALRVALHIECRSDGSYRH